MVRQPQVCKLNSNPTVRETRILFQDFFPLNADPTKSPSPDSQPFRFPGKLMEQ